MERRDYLELMTGQIRCKKMCPVIAKEVEDHIEDQKQAFMAEGMKEEEAEKAAVEEMGDPVEVGVEMDQIHRPKMPWKVIFVIALMQILSGMFAAFFLKQNESYGYIAGIRQIFRLAMAGTVGLSCVFMLMLALEKGWYQVAITKVMTGIGISVVGVPVGILAYFFFFGAEYQKSRILAMFAVNKSQMMEGTTLGAVRELLSKCMAVGRATGVEDFWTGDRISSADYMMLGIAGYCGILVMVLCIAIIAGLLCWFLRSALKQKNQLGMMMGFGCVMVLAIQFLLSLLANIGVSGFGQGAWCLFFGYGRSGQMVSAVLMGILLSIYRHQNVTPELVVEKRAVAS